MGWGCELCPRLPWGVLRSEAYTGSLNCQLSPPKPGALHQHSPPLRHALSLRHQRQRPPPQLTDDLPPGQATRSTHSVLRASYEDGPYWTHVTGKTEAQRNRGLGLISAVTLWVHGGVRIWARVCLMSKPLLLHSLSPLSWSKIPPESVQGHAAFGFREAEHRGRAHHSSLPLGGVCLPRLNQAS